MKKLLLVIFFIALCCSLHAQTLKWVEGTKHLPDSLNSSVTGGGKQIVAAPDGGVYVLGVFSGKYSFGGIYIEPVDFSLGMYLIKFDKYGKGVWYKNLKYFDRFVGMAADEEGNIFISGNLAMLYSEEIQIGDCSFPLEGDRRYRPFMVKLDAQGSCVWISELGSDFYGKINSIAHSKTGNILITGSGGGTIGSYQTSAGKFFVASLSPDGTVQWIAKATGDPRSEGYRVDTDDAGNSYITGAYTGGTISFGQYRIEVEARGLFLVKYSPEGEAQWAVNTGDEQFGEKKMSPAIGIVCDGGGNCYITGNARRGTLFGEHRLESVMEYPLFVASYNTDGQCQWVEASQLGGRNRISALGGDGIALYNDRLYIWGYLNGPVRFGELTLSAESFLASFTTQGEAKWLTEIRFGYKNQIAVDSEGLIYMTGSNAVEDWRPYTQGWPSYVAQYASEANSISGYVFIDSNEDGIFNEGDLPQPNIVIEASPGGYTTLTDKEGRYRIYVPSGAHTIQVAQAPKYHNVSTEPYQVEFTGVGTATEGKDFAFARQPDVTDGRVIFTHSGHNRPGFESVLVARVKNVGTVAQSGEVQIRVDSQFETLGSEPAAEVTGNTFVWQYTDLAVGGEKRFEIRVRLPATTPLNSELVSVATLNAEGSDAYLIDNSDTSLVVVVGSYDPNDKAVSDTIMSPGQVAQGAWLDYTIRFQNLGNAEAIFVSVKDTLSDLLNIGSFEMLDASHTYELKLTERGALEWFFDDIYLPAEMHDEQGSHGFVKYRIRPKTSVALADRILNKASIYFDYNEPIVTNTVVSAVVAPVVTHTSLPVTSLLQVYPNPASDRVNVVYQGTLANGQIEIYNMLGSKVLQQSMVQQNGRWQAEIDVSQLPGKLYILRICGATHSVVLRVILK
jgi:hypothetical protein